MTAAAGRRRGEQTIATSTEAGTRVGFGQSPAMKELLVDPETVPVHDWQHNVLRDRLDVAADRADRAVEAVGRRGTNPLAAAVSRLSTAWVAEGSSARVACSESLLGVGAAIRSAFVTGAQQLRSKEQSEPRTIDVAEHPELDWKTSSAGIDSRVWAYSRGYR